MKTIYITILFITISLGSFAQKTAQEFVGTWEIDLRPTPESEPYIKEFVVKSIKKNTLKGTFYGSQIKEGFINKKWRRTYFAFSTSDNTHTYYHSGYFLDGKVYAISYCPTRSLTTPWRGEIARN